MVTLAALCLAHRIGMIEEGERELARICQPEMVAKIRAKQAAKPKHSPLPGPAPSSAVDGASDRPGMLRAAALARQVAEAQVASSRGGLGSMFADQSAADLRAFADRLEREAPPAPEAR